jgi:hypothetical protein
MSDLFSQALFTPAKKLDTPGFPQKFVFPFSRSTSISTALSSWIPFSTDCDYTLIYLEFYVSDGFFSRLNPRVVFAQRFNQIMCFERFFLFFTTFSI